MVRRPRDPHAQKSKLTAELSMIRFRAHTATVHLDNVLSISPSDSIEAQVLKAIEHMKKIEEYVTSLEERAS